MIALILLWLGQALPAVEEPTPPGVYWCLNDWNERCVCQEFDKELIVVCGYSPLQ
jgi:hypothetical protein